MNELIEKTFTYEGNRVSFKKDQYVMISATEMAKAFPGKRPTDWLKSQSTKEFIAALSGVRKIVPSDLVRVINGDGGGTWMHEDVALEFARWLSPAFAIWCNDRIKELLTIGSTQMPQTYLQALKALVAAEEAKEKLEAQQRQLVEDNQYKSEVIEGLTEQISVADMRQRINQVVRKGSGGDIQGVWHMLYEEFNRKFHLNIFTRMTNANIRTSPLDYIDQELGMLPDLYELACKLFESSYQQLMDSWGKYAKRAEIRRRRR